MADIPEDHKQIFKYLLKSFGEPAKVIVYRDNQGKRPIDIGEFGSGKRFYSTIGICEKPLKLPSGHFEFAAIGKTSWLPNALASSIYWLRDRSVRQWPVVCEDVIRHNVKSRYRHMAYVSSSIAYELPSGLKLRWLLGVPITDTEISLEAGEVTEKAQKLYPKWLLG